MLYQFKFPFKILAVTVHLLINTVISLLPGMVSITHASYSCGGNNSAAARLGTARSAKP